jgi:hypothetical protein
MGADNALDLMRTGDGSLAAAVAGTPATRACAPLPQRCGAPRRRDEQHASDALILNGVVSQSVYIGQAIDTACARRRDIWVNAPSATRKVRGMPLSRARRCCSFRVQQAPAQLPRRSP